MHFTDKSRAVISVFLIITMIPLLGLAVVLVDGSRVQSAKMMVQEASDLAAMSTLAGYNKDLKNDYGLFALKNPGNAQTVFESYLNSSLKSAVGGDNEYSDRMYEAVKGLVFDNSSINGFTNLFNYNVGSSNVSTLYDLSKKDVLQNQIVEYTKYRGVYFLADRLSLLANLSEIQNEYEDTKKSSELMEEKLNIDEEAAKNVEEKIQKLNEKIQKFHDAIGGVTNSSEIGSVKSNMRSAMDGADNAYRNHIDDENWDENLSMAYNVYNSNGQVTTLMQQLESSCKTLDSAGAEAYKKFDDIKLSDVTDIQSSIENEITKLKNFKTEKVDSSDASVAEEMKADIDETLKKYEKYKNVVQSLKTYMESAQYSEDKKYLNMSKSMYGNTYLALKNSLTDIMNSPASLKENGKNSVQYYGMKIVNNEYKVDRAYILSGDNARHNYYGTQANQGCPWYSDMCGKAAEHMQMLDVSDNSEEVDYRDKAKETVSDANEKKDSFTGNKIPDGEAGILPSKGASERNDEKENYETDPDKMTKNTHSVLSSAVDWLSGLGEATRDEALTYSYIFGMFKTRMTGNEKFKSSAKPESWKDYHVKWRYENDDGEHDLREKAKSAQDSVLNAEVEYIFGGSKSDNVNTASVYAIIYGTRVANNIAAVYANKQARLQCYEMACATAAALAAFGIVISPTVYQWIFITAWAIAETCAEMDFLVNDGYRIPLIKTGSNLMIQSFGDVANLEMRLQNSVKNTPINVCYEEYLLILMCLMTNSETRVMRVADLIQLNMRKRHGDDFLMKEAPTYIMAETEISISYLFRQVSQFSGFYPGNGISFKNTIYQGY